MGHVVIVVVSQLWNLCHHHLPTSDWITSLDKEEQQPCFLCGGEFESINHVFCICNFSMMVWNLLQLHLHITFSYLHNWPNGEWLNDESIDDCSYSNCVLRALIDNCLWFIWNVRNDAMHNHVICKLLSLVYKAAACTYDISHFSHGRKRICQLQVKWEFPPLRWNKRNVDGSWNHDLN